MDDAVFFDHTATPGGGQLESLRLLPRLKRVRPRALFATGGYTADKLSDAGIPVRVLDRREIFHAWQIPLHALRVWKTLRSVPADTPVVALSTAAAQILAFLPRSGRVRVLRLNEDLQRFTGRGWKSLLYFGWIFRRYDGFVSNSRWTSSTIPDSLQHVPLTEAYSLSGITSPPERERPPFSEPVLRVACFSRAARWKGLDLAIDAVSRVSAQGIPVTLELHGGEWQGEPGYRDELRRLAQASGAPVKFEGHVEDVLAVMSDVDMVIMPSRLPEPFGQVTVQSLAAGCLTVVSDHGGSLELVEDGVTGRTFRRDDPEDLAQILAWAAENREQAALIAQAGAASAARLTDAALGESLENALVRVLADARSSARTPHRRMNSNR